MLRFTKGGLKLSGISIVLNCFCFFYLFVEAPVLDTKTVCFQDPFALLNFCFRGLLFEFLGAFWWPTIGFLLSK